MAYRIMIAPAAAREMKKLDRLVGQQIADTISGLALDPRPTGVRKLTGSTNGYRLRVGDYRILYQITDKVLLVLVVKVGHRRDVYR